jgi:hypothetical protein
LDGRSWAVCGLSAIGCWAVESGPSVNAPIFDIQHNWLSVFFGLKSGRCQVGVIWAGVVSSKQELQFVRPKTIIWFEWVFLITLIFPVVSSALSGEALLQKGLPAMAFLLPVALLILKFAMVFLVSRKRNRVALWTLVILTSLAILTAVYAVLKVGLMVLLLKSLIVPSIQALALALLFLPVSQQWLRTKKTTGSLEDTFS